MPTVTGIDGPYRLFFYSYDCGEPPHVHVRRDRNECKVWLHDVEVAWASGFHTPELSAIRTLILQHENRILEAWREHCRAAAR